MASFRHSHSTLHLVCISLLPTLLLSIDVSTLLSSHPDFSDFTSLLYDTSVTGDLAHRSSLTILAVPNSYLRSSLSALELNSRPSSSLGDVLRYHVLLQFLSWPELRQIPPDGKLVTTLLQTTGRAHSDLGAVNLTVDSNGTVTARSLSVYPPSNATLLSLVKTLPYNISIFAVDSLLLPYGFDLAASKDVPPQARLNITDILTNGKSFNVAAAMLMASGVVEEFENDERGAGITIFVPTDAAFAGLPPERNIQSLPANLKAVVLKFHVLHSYYPLGSLESIVNPVQPTLATEDSGAGRFTLNITRLNGSVAIGTGIVQAEITQTVFDENPVSVFGVSRVLLPKEVFGNNPVVAPTAPPPETGLPPENTEHKQPARLETPPSLGHDGNSNGGNGSEQMGLWVALFCISLYVFQ